MGGSVSIFSVKTASVSNIAELSSNIAQSYNGKCSFGVTEQIDNVHINTNVNNGTINVVNSTELDGTCSFSVNMTSLSDLIASFQGVANAIDNAQFLKVHVEVAGYSSTSVKSYENLRMSINNSVSQSCSYTINDVIKNVYMNVGQNNGVINISNDTSGNASCVMNSLMQASTSGSARSNENASTGTGFNTGMLEALGGILGIVLIVMIVVYVIKYAFSNQNATATKGTTTKGGNGTTNQYGINDLINKYGGAEGGAEGGDLAGMIEANPELLLV